MNPFQLTAASAALAVLAACSQSDPAGTDAAQPPTASSAPPAPRAGEAPTPSGPPLEAAPLPPINQGRTDGVNDGYPDLTPVETTDEVRRTEKGARAVLLPFARAIELKEFDQAWAMMDENAHQRWSKAEWNELFAGLQRITVGIPGGRMEGAAGSSYYSSPATITATDRDGRLVAIEGPIVLKRVNDVPGATAEQLSWRVHSADLVWTH